MKKLSAIIAALLLALLGLLACQTQTSYGNGWPQTKLLSSYAADFGRPLADRITGSPPEFVLENLRLLDNQPSYAPYPLTETERSQIADALRLIPINQPDLLNSRVVGIYLVDHFLGAGMADWARDEQNQIYVVLILNPALLKTTIDDWLTLRENSAFSPGRYHLRARTGLSGSALEYVMRHEGAHVADYLEQHTPFTEPHLPGIDRAGPADRAFTRTVWRDYHTPVPAFDFRDRTKLHFYGLDQAKPLANDQIPILLAALAKTPFVSLYGSKSWAEDWAETTTCADLARLTGQAWKWEIWDGDQLMTVFQPTNLDRVRADQPATN